MDIKSGIIEIGNGNSESWKVGRIVRDEKSPNGYSIHYLGHGYA